MDGKGNEERACHKFVDCIRCTQTYCKTVRFAGGMRNSKKKLKKTMMMMMMMIIIRI